MREKAAQGIYPSRPPLGYRNNKLLRTIEVDPDNAPIAQRTFELYATGMYSLATLRRFLKTQYVTAEFKKQKYTYYRCTGYRGKCDLPYFREEVMAERLGQVLEAIRIPDDALAQLEESLLSDKTHEETLRKRQAERIEQRLALTPQTAGAGLC